MSHSGGGGGNECIAVYGAIKNSGTHKSSYQEIAQTIATYNMLSSRDQNLSERPSAWLV